MSAGRRLGFCVRAPLGTAGLVAAVATRREHAGAYPLFVHFADGDEVTGTCRLADVTVDGFNPRLRRALEQITGHEPKRHYYDAADDLDPAEAHTWR